MHDWSNRFESNGEAFPRERQTHTAHIPHCSLRYVCQKRVWRAQKPAIPDAEGTCNVLCTASKRCAIVLGIKIARKSTSRLIITEQNGCFLPPNHTEHAEPYWCIPPETGMKATKLLIVLKPLQHVRQAPALHYTPITSVNWQLELFLSFYEWITCCVD